MRILVFTSLYPNNIWPSHGVFIKERMTQVAKFKKCMVKVIAPVPYYPRIGWGRRQLFSLVNRYEKIEGVDVYHPRYFITPKIGMSFYGVMMFLSVFPFVKRIQKEFDFDIIDAHYVYPDGLAAVLLGITLKKPVVVSARGSDINLFPRFPIIRKLIQYTLRNTNKIITVSQALKQIILEMSISGDKISCIPNGVHQSKFYRIPQTDARREIRLPVDKKIVLSVGNLKLNKGFDLLIKSLKVLVEDSRDQDILLVIVGEGKYRRVLVELVSSLNLDEHVMFVGRVPHEELYRWYSAANCFCLASEHEGWPNVVLESLACGTPVVATSVGGIPDILSLNNIGILTDRSVNDIADKLSRAFRTSWNPDEIVKHAKQYTWNRSALSVFQVFESVLHQHSPNS